ncbi:MAG TPA: putative Ig domain-containing protein [Thermoflexus sp.]|nr:putative Ig domain-containing protein [Thermoflexus sp.]
MKNVRQLLIGLLSILACTSPFQRVGATPLQRPIMSPPASPTIDRAASSLETPTGIRTAALNMDPLPNGGLFILGDPIRIHIAQRPNWVRYRLTDAYGPADWTVNGAVFEGDGFVQPDATGAWLYLPTDRLTRYGFYGLDVFTDQGDLTGLRIGLVDPIIRLGPGNPSPLGFIIAVDPYPGFAGQIAYLGIKWVHFDIPVDTDDSVRAALSSEIQSFVSQALAHDVTPIFKLIGGAPPGAADYNSRFYQNLRDVARAYRGQVRHWIVGNEIDGCGWWNPCDYDLYVTFLRGIAQTVRSIDPEARILAADLYQGDSSVLRKMLEEERRDPSFTLFDILSVHYLEEGNGEGLSPDGCCGSINTYRQVLQAYGIVKPIWNTEALSPLRGGIHWASNETSYFRGGQAIPLLSPAKTVVGNLAVGAEKIFFFSYNYDQSLLENNGRTLTERALAVRALADQIQTATYYGRLSGTPSFVEGHLFKNGSETILVIWSNEGNRDIQAVMSGMNGPVTLFDPLGNAYALQESNGRVKFRVHYEPQYLRGFTGIPTVTFENDGNDTPYFVSNPITTAVVGRPYYYRAEAYDPDPTGQPNALVPLTYALEQGPSEMRIDPNSGVLTWTPTQAGRFNVRLRVRDPQGASTTQTFELQVVGSAQNAPPQILSRPRTTFSAVGMPFAYNVNATDPNGDPITYQLTQSPAWLTIDAASGFVYGIPSEPGVFSVTIRATDSKGAWTEQSFALQIAPGGANAPPQISEGPTATPLATATLIRWRTLQAADSRVRYGRTCGSWEQTIIRPEWVVDHAVWITGLQPNTGYCYEVQSVNTGGASEWRRGTFITLAREHRSYLPLIMRR